jgi:Domain of unknown function (DUF3854)/AAA domain
LKAKKSPKKVSTKKDQKTVTAANGLRPKDLTMFRHIGVTPQLLKKAGIRRITTAEAHNFGFKSRSHDNNGLLFPYATLAGEVQNYRLRRDNPLLDAKGNPEAKYISLPSPAPRLLYLPPGAHELLKDPKTPVLIVESEKAALASTAAADRAGRSVLAMATGGCWGWRAKGDPNPDTNTVETAPLPDLALAQARDVTICFDANVVTNAQVQAAERALALYLTIQQQARVRRARVPVQNGVNGPDDYLAIAGDKAFWEILDSASESPWLESLFASYEKMLVAPPLRFAIRQFLQADVATFIGGLSGHGKTLLLLNIAKALLSGRKLFNHFPVSEAAQRVIYLIPESTLGPFFHRLKLFHLDEHVKSRRLLVRTLSEGPILPLTDPELLLMARGADIFLDTAVRFMEGEESAAGDVKRSLSDAILALLGAGARTVIAAHHSPKQLEKESYLSLENVLRGSGELGAVAGTVWGIKQLDVRSNRVYVQNVKPRDFEPPPPFMLEGRPFIDEDGAFRMVKAPGHCGVLSEEQPGRSRGGRPPDPVKHERVRLVQEWRKEQPKLTSKQVAAKFEEMGTKLTESVVKKYMQEAKFSYLPNDREAK